MRVLLQSRTTLFSVPGGDTIQIQKTAEHLRKLGCNAEISLAPAPPLAGFDLVHLFNLGRPQDIFTQAENARRHRVPVVLSTVYVSYLEYERKARTGVVGALAKVTSEGQLEYLKVLARALNNREFHAGASAVLSRGFRTLQRELLTKCSALLPNSESELRRVHHDFPTARSIPAFIVPNAADVHLFSPEPKSDDPFLEFEGSILCVARIEGRKNQLNLLRAAKSLDVPTVFVGKAAPNHGDYFQQLRREASDQVHFVDHMEHSQLPALYRRAKVHALVSWMETTGLSSLEAAASGCNIVLTAKGDTRDYFRDFGFYCEPDSVISIRNALTQALRNPRDERLVQRVRSQFTWEKAASSTLQAYEATLRSAAMAGQAVGG